MQRNQNALCNFTLLTSYIPAAFFFVNLRRRRSGWTMVFVGVAFFGEIRCLHKKKNYLCKRLYCCHQ